jgi:hypothetical protein
MLKLLQITSFVLLGVSAAASVYFVISRDGAAGDVRAFLESPLTAQTYGGDLPDTMADGSSKAPLVVEAEALSLRLNPPPPKVARPDPGKSSPQSPSQATPPQPARPKTPVVAKFDLLGTVVNHARPSLSMIFIDVPGEGQKWVYQGESVGRLRIDEVKEDSVVYSDGDNTAELAMVDHQSQIKSLLKSDNPQAPAASPAAAAKPAAPGSAAPRPARIAPQGVARPSRATPAPAPAYDPAEDKKKLESSLEAMGQWKTGSEEEDKNLAEAMKKVQEMMENAQKIEAMEKK